MIFINNIKIEINLNIINNFNTYRRIVSIFPLVFFCRSVRTCAAFDRPLVQSYRFCIYAVSSMIIEQI